MNRNGLYQDRWHKGRRTQRGQRDCADRYALIADQIRQRDLKDFRALDLGAYAGYFSLRLAEDFKARVTAVDDCPNLIPSVRYEPRVRPINRRVTPDEIRELGPFDVVLALSVLHHVPNYRNMLAALREVTQELFFVEYPNPDETLPKAAAHTNDLFDACAELPGKVIGFTEGYRNKYLRPLKVVSA